jgi:hypothetical protein
MHLKDGSKSSTTSQKQQINQQARDADLLFQTWPE